MPLRPSVVGWVSGIACATKAMKAVEPTFAKSARTMRVGRHRSRLNNLGWSEVPQNFGSLQLRQVRWNILLDLRAHLGFEFVEQLMIDFFAGGQETAFDLLASGQGVESVGKLAHLAFAQFQPDVMPLAIRHRAARVGAARAARKSAGQIADSIAQPPVGLGVVEGFDQFEPRGAIEVMVFEFEGFETCKIGDHNQSVFHNPVVLKS